MKESDGRLVMCMRLEAARLRLVETIVFGCSDLVKSRSGIASGSVYKCCHGYFLDDENLKGVFPASHNSQGSENVQ